MKHCFRSASYVALGCYALFQSRWLLSPPLTLVQVLCSCPLPSPPALPYKGKNGTRTVHRFFRSLNISAFLGGVGFEGSYRMLRPSQLRRDGRVGPVYVVLRVPCLRHSGIIKVVLMTWPFI